MYFNGASAVGLTIPLTGAVADGDVYVVAQASASAPILAQADQTSGAGWFTATTPSSSQGRHVIDSVGQWASIRRGVGQRPEQYVGQHAARRRAWRRRHRPSRFRPAAHGRFRHRHVRRPRRARGRPSNPPVLDCGAPLAPPWHGGSPYGPATTRTTRRRPDRDGRDTAPSAGSIAVRPCPPTGAAGRESRDHGTGTGRRLVPVTAPPPTRRGTGACLLTVT